MVSAVFYKISNIRFCIYIKWINPLTLKSNMNPESQKKEDREGETLYWKDWRTLSICQWQMGSRHKHNIFLWLAPALAPHWAQL